MGGLRGSSDRQSERNGCYMRSAGEASPELGLPYTMAQGLIPLRESGQLRPGEPLALDHALSEFVDPQVQVAGGQAGALVLASWWRCGPRPTQAGPASGRTPQRM